MAPVESDAATTAQDAVSQAGQDNQRKLLEETIQLLECAQLCGQPQQPGMETTWRLTLQKWSLQTAEETDPGVLTPATAAGA